MAPIVPGIHSSWMAKTTPEITRLAPRIGARARRRLLPAARMGMNSFERWRVVTVKRAALTATTGPSTWQ
jgi:hypothetical protein